MPNLPKNFTITVKTRFVSDLFSISIKHFADTTRMTMKVYTQEISTQYIPATFDILKKKLPRVLYSKCFNDLDLPFSEEVKATEIGHLFEHILLEYLCLEKVAYGFDEATYNGLTNWNWQKDPYGTFYITIDAGHKDLAIFPKALQKTINLVTSILESIPITQEAMSSIQDVPSNLNVEESNRGNLRWF